MGYVLGILLHVHMAAESTLVFMKVTHYETLAECEAAVPFVEVDGVLKRLPTRERYMESYVACRRAK